jgi:uncharacterized protein with NAD-binding domain and iron-sulfur cluster
MAAAWGLMNSEAADTLDVTIYQIGWRLGGKGASGRNQKIANRIEEHGLHIWGGMYENAFAIMRQVYGQLKRPAGTPLSVWYDAKQPNASAFLPHSNTTLAEFYNGTWLPWNLDVPSDDALPGDGRELPTITEYIDLALDLLEEVLFGDRKPWQDQSAPPPPGQASSAFARLADVIAGIASDGLRLAAHAAFHLRAKEHIHRARRGLRALPDDPAQHTPAHHAAVHGPLQDLEHAFLQMFASWIDGHPGIRRIYMILDLGNALVHGILEDRILEKGIDVIDDMEFSAWLGKHGASDMTLNGALIRGWHDFFFAFADGDGTRPTLSAASGLRTMLRYTFTYRGAFFWKMQAGMGDTIFAPLYQALKQKGVTFAFFHRVDALRIGANDVIEAIDVSRQVDLAIGVTEYNPLLGVEGVDSWPSKPLYEQLNADQAAKLQADKINLESWWTPWKPVASSTLQRGTDFDDVILAMPPHAARYVTKDLSARLPKWGAMLDGIRSNQTIAAQIWLSLPLAKLGWPYPSTVGTVYSNPFNTWANMDQLLKRESWGSRSNPPQCVIYFCGTLTDAEPIQPFDVHVFPHDQKARARESAVTWMDSNIASLFPAAAYPGISQVNWTLLDPTRTHEGEACFDQQFWRLNIDPSERYVISPPGTASVRVRAHESGFSNLWLAGDWLRTGINAGCVEAAVMGGLQASQAMTGFPKVIVGDDL